MCCFFNRCCRRRCCRRCCCEHIMLENEEFARRLRSETRYVFRNIYLIESRSALALDSGSTVFSNRVFTERRYC